MVSKTVANRVLVGQVLKHTPANPLAAVQAVTSLFEQIVVLRKLGADERVAHSRIEAQRDVVLNRMQHDRELIMDASDKVFGARREVFENLWKHLDAAQRDGNNEQFAHLLGGIVDIAKHSPIVEIRDFAVSLRRPETVIDFDD